MDQYLLTDLELSPWGAEEEDNAHHFVYASIRDIMSDKKDCKTRVLLNKVKNNSIYGDSIGDLEKRVATSSLPLKENRSPPASYKKCFKIRNRDTNRLHTEPVGEIENIDEKPNWYME